MSPAQGPYEGVAPVDGLAAAQGRLGRPIKVVLVEDHHLVREGLRLVLTNRGIDVVGEAPSIAEAFQLIDLQQPDIALIDLSLADGDGVSLVRDVRARAPGIKMLVVTMHRDPETVRQALLAGADGYLVKGAHSVDLIAAISAVMRGERYLHSSIAGIVVDDSLRWLHASTTVTAREREILGLLANDLDAADIGRQLGISRHTVRRHVANLSDKLGIRGTTALVRYAIREGYAREREA